MKSRSTEQSTVASEDQAATTLTSGGFLDGGAELAGDAETRSKAKEPIIENELPTYRAIDRLAIVSLSLGVASILCFANLWFAPASVGAVVFGILADRQIRRYRDEYTGRGLAQTGIALGLIFGLTSSTSSYVSDFILRTNAERFARKYADDVLMKGKLADAVWYAMPSEVRVQYTTNGAYEKIRAAGQETFEQQMGGIIRVKDRLDSVPGKMKIEFVELEGASQVGEKILALALLRISGPTTARYRDPVEYALAELEARRGKDGKFLWQAVAVHYPYVPHSKTFQPPKPVDDGHGHEH